jgi:Ala-tRNA(Pro) deacylase
MASPNLSKYHPVVAQIIELLEKNSCWFETFEHKPVRTSEEAAKIRTGYSISQGAKALIVRIKITNSDKKFVMLVVPADKRFDPAKVKAMFNAKDVRFATEEEVSDLTSDVQPGGVPPFGNLFNLEFIVDPLLFENEKIVFNAGDRSFSVAMKSEDYKRILEPRIESII